MKKIISLIAAAALALTAASCASGNDSSSESSSVSAVGDESSQTKQISEPETEEANAETQEGGEAVELPEPPEPEQTPAAHKTGDTMFDLYPSNTVVATGNNHLIPKAENVTYRAYFPVEEYGELEYCFYFSNTVDSTYNSGKPVYVGAETGSYEIIGARIADGGLSTEDEITNYTEVSFDGESGREVSRGESFWSDPVTFSLDEGHYLVWEWTLSGKQIAGIQMSDLTSSTSSEDGEEFEYCNKIALPSLIGAKRDTKLNVTAIGDSITQGCQTEFMAYEFWAAQISQKLGEDYGFWNCGLGWARASDAATKGDWLERAKHSDVAIVAFGTNDISSGEYGGDGGNTAEEIDSYVRTLITELSEADCEVIVFNAPPHNYDEEKEAVRTEYNEMLKATCDELGAYYFDFASCLCDPETPSEPKYGGHPNGEAGGIVSDAFIEEFSVLLGL